MYDDELQQLFETFQQNLNTLTWNVKCKKFMHSWPMTLHDMSKQWSMNPDFFSKRLRLNQDAYLNRCVRTWEITVLKVYLICNCPLRDMQDLHHMCQTHFPKWVRWLIHQWVDHQYHSRFSSHNKQFQERPHIIHTLPTTVNQQNCGAKMNRDNQSILDNIVLYPVKP